MQQKQWRRQNDVVQQAFIVATMITELGTRAVLVDGFFSKRVKAEAIASGDPIGYLNTRCHARGLKTRRLLVLDTTTSDNGVTLHTRYRLHFHGVFKLPEGMTIPEFIELLRKVFGRAKDETTGKDMGARQFEVVRPDYTKGYAHNSIHAKGALGKLFYALRHAGTTYNDLGFNGDRGRREGPKSRMAANTRAAGLAKGNASNFNKDIVMCDAVSKRAGKAMFETWVEAEQAALATRPAPRLKPVKKRRNKPGSAEKNSAKDLILLQKTAIIGEFQDGSETPLAGSALTTDAATGAKRNMRRPGTMSRAQGST